MTEQANHQNESSKRQADGERHELAVSFEKMTRPAAEVISIWQYPMPYALYSMDGSADCLAELMNGQYYAGYDPEGTIIGFICHGQSARVSGGYSCGVYD